MTITPAGCNSTTPLNGIPPGDMTGTAAFRFVQSLGQELSAGTFDLPSFPDIAIRVRQVLADEDVKPEKIVRVVSAEPALAARLLHIANSAAISFSGKTVTDLRTAVARLGFNMVRSAAIAFAMWQLRKSEALKGLEKQLEELWESSTSVAAVAYVVARRLGGVNADTALLAGLLHGVGKLYILSRAHQHQDLLADPTTYSCIVRDWHSNIAKALLEQWQMPEEIVIAVNEFEDLDRDHAGPADLSDMLTIACLLVRLKDHPEEIDLELQGVGAAKRLQLRPDACWQLLKESAGEIAIMQQALGW
jgi:HD-like signal output (HDOD) protein